MKLLVTSVLVLLGVVLFSWIVTPKHSAPINPAVETSAAAKVLAAQRAIDSQVHLQAKPWNNGYVHMWAILSESDNNYRDVPESASCTRMDDHTYKLGSGSTTLFYYKLACNGVVGYVERDQVR